MTWSNLRFNIGRSFVTMATNLPSCLFIQVIEQLLKFLVKFTLLKYVKSQRSSGFLTLPVPSLLLPHLIPIGGGGGGGGSVGPPAISKALGPMSSKFCRVLETSFKVLEI